MFNRGKRDAREEAAREAERKALFAKLAERPDTVCPFLGLADDRTGYEDGATEAHRCYAFGDPAPLSSEQQTRVCLERGYGNCPRYLRGVLVIPTEELEALRRPRPAAAAAPPPPPARRRRAVPLAVLGVLLLGVVAGGALAWAMVNGSFDGVAAGSPSPTPAVTAAPTTPPPSPTPTVAATATPAATPAPTTTAPVPTEDPTPQPEDVFAFYEVGVNAGEYTLYEIDDDGSIVLDRPTTFSRESHAQVDRVEAPNGLLHWRTLNGALVGLSYIYPDSGDFEIRAVYRRPDGSRSSELVPEEEL